jgi:hypothetical protein
LCPFVGRLLIMHLCLAWMHNNQTAHKWAQWSTAKFGPRSAYPLRAWKARMPRSTSPSRTAFSLFSCLPAFLPSCLPTFPPSCIAVCLPACLGMSSPGMSSPGMASPCACSSLLLDDSSSCLQKATNRQLPALLPSLPPSFLASFIASFLPSFLPAEATPAEGRHKGWPRRQQDSRRKEDATCA